MYGASPASSTRTLEADIVGSVNSTLTVDKLFSIIKLLRNRLLLSLDRSDNVLGAALNVLQLQRRGESTTLKHTCPRSTHKIFSAPIPAKRFDGSVSSSLLPRLLISEDINRVARRNTVYWDNTRV